MTMKEDLEKVDVFWTGGMDSTFRVIQLLLTTDYLVQPHYIVRHEHSTGIEIHIMIILRRMIARKYPHIQSRFLPTIYVNEGLIPEYKDISDQIENLRKIRIVTDQYQLMANYCRKSNITNVEVALVKKAGNEDKLKLFKQCEAFNKFSYPIVNLTKKDMFKIAKEQGYYYILNKTIFCHRPHVKITPCGTCGPCNDAVMQGMGFRLPIFPHLKALITVPLRKYWRKNYLNQDDSKFFKLIKKKFEHRF